MFLRHLWRHPLFLTGFLFLFLLVIASFAYSSYFAGMVDPDPPKALFNDNGQLLEDAPFSPSWQYPLGSDQFGHQMILVLLEGAKYTIGLAVLISFASMLISIVFGLLLSYLPYGITFLIKRIFDSFYYAPLALFTYLLAAPVVLVFTWSYGEAPQIYFPIIVLIALSVPILSVFIANETGEVLQKEFIANARVMGGGRYHIFWKHAFPYVGPKLLMIFSQQVARMLIVLAQLGLVHIFIGGGKEKVTGYILEGRSMTIKKEWFSSSNEWAGLIGKYWTDFTNAPWLVMGPVTAFALTIIAVNFMTEGMKESLGEKRRVKKANDDRNMELGRSGEKSFEFVGNGISSK